MCSRNWLCCFQNGLPLDSTFEISEKSAKWLQRIEETTIVSINSYFPILLSNYLPTHTSHRFHLSIPIAPVVETCNNSTIHPKSVVLPTLVRHCFCQNWFTYSDCFLSYSHMRIGTSHFYNANRPKWSRHRKMDGFLSQRIRDKKGDWNKTLKRKQILEKKAKPKLSWNNLNFVYGYVGCVLVCHSKLTEMDSIMHIN